MFKGTKLEWAFTLVGFFTGVAVLIASGVEDRGVIGALSFGFAAIFYAAIVAYEKKRRKDAT